MRSMRLARLSVFATLCFAHAAVAQQLIVKPSKPSGIYSVNEKIEWTVTVKDATPREVKEISAGLKVGGAEPTQSIPLDLSSGTATVETKLTAPNTVLLVIKATIAGKPGRFLGGAVADPAKISRSAPRPEDFDAFWDGKLKMLRELPVNAKIEPGDSGSPDVDYAKVTLDNINHTHVYGQIARPKKEGRYPAVILFQYAGIYPLPKSNVTSRAKSGWLAMNIMAHDLPLDKDQKFYDDQKAGPLKNANVIGDDDREKCYFLRMYLGCVRAVDYITTCPDWDGKTIVVMGTSQGGAQTLIATGLCPNVTAGLANMPGACDTTAPLAGRAPGFPFYNLVTPTSTKINNTATYFDAANFASRIKCPMLVGTGLIDETCPPPGVLVMFSQLTVPKEIVIMPYSDHQGHNGTQVASFKRMEEWLSAIKKGSMPEPKITEGF